jgi:hypothetical protein
MTNHLCCCKKSEAFEPYKKYISTKKNSEQKHKNQKQKKIFKKQNVPSIF